jgi:hypothetical protein
LIGFGCLKLITVDIVYSTWPCNMARHVCAARPWRARAPLPRPPCQCIWAQQGSRAYVGAALVTMPASQEHGRL